MKKKKSKKTKIKPTYFIIAGIIIVAMFLTFAIAWKECQRYQDHSASTVISKEIERLKQVFDCDFSCDMIPAATSEGYYEYTLFQNGEKFAVVTLEKTENGIFDLALFEVKKVTGAKSIAIVIPDGLDIYVDDSLYSGESETYYIEGTEDFETYGYEAASFKKYVVTELFYTESVCVKEGNTEIKLMQLEDGCYLGTKLVSDSNKQSIKDNVADYSDKYAHYMSNDLNFWTFNTCFAADSPLYYRFINLDVQWYTKHLSAYVDNLNISDPMYLADRCVMVNSDFDYVVNYYGTIVTDYTELCFILHQEDDGSWKMFELYSSHLYDLE